MRRFFSVSVVFLLFLSFVYGGLALEPPGQVGDSQHRLFAHESSAGDLGPQGRERAGAILAEGSEVQDFSDFPPALVDEGETPAGPDDYEADTVLLKLRPSGGGFALRALPFAEYGVLSLQPVLPPVVTGGSGLMAAGGKDKEGATWYKARLLPGSDVLAAVRSLQSDPRVEVAEPDYFRYPQGVLLPEVSTDGLLDEQWHLGAAGVLAAWQHLAAVDLPPGGSSEVVVAVIDTGVDYTHPDLAPNMWINPREIPGNGIDDDNNGYTDDIHGISTVDGHKSGDPMDSHGHGTHVAGIIAGAAGNGGIVGVAFNVRILAVNAYDGEYLTSSAIVAGIYYALDQGAQVINMSFGGSSSSGCEEDALAAAYGQAVLVAAAGNENKHNSPATSPAGTPIYPASYKWVLGVMAMDKQVNTAGDWLAEFSNWDRYELDAYEYGLMAPGSRIFSTLPDDNYGWMSGTSMATPIVSGVAALLCSEGPAEGLVPAPLIMTRLGASGEPKQGKTIEAGEQRYYTAFNAFDAVSNAPVPQVRYFGHLVFDSEYVPGEDEGEGAARFAEAFDIALVLRNYGQDAAGADVTISTDSADGTPDPYVSALDDTVAYGAVGALQTSANGLTVGTDGEYALSVPFRFLIAENTPSNYLVPVQVTISARNAANEMDSQVYVTDEKFYILVRRSDDSLDATGESNQLASGGNGEEGADPKSFGISHEPILTAEQGFPLQFLAEIQAEGETFTAELYYRAMGAQAYQKEILFAAGGDTYVGILDGSLVNKPGLEYYIEVSDGENTVKARSADSPYSVVVNADPYITGMSYEGEFSAGEARVAIYGANFRPELRVLLNREPMQFVHVSANRIDVITSLQDFARADVKIVNKDGSLAFYRPAPPDPPEKTLEFSLGSGRTEPGIERALPLSIVTNGQEWQSLKLILEYNPAAIQSVTVALGSDLAENIQVETNAEEGDDASGEGSETMRLSVTLTAVTPFEDGKLLDFLLIPVGESGISAGLSLLWLEKEDAPPVPVVSAELMVALPGDANLDNEVDFLDLALVAYSYGINNYRVDMNNDGIVNEADLPLVSGLLYE